MSGQQAAVLDLAPGNPYSLLVRSPILPAPGCHIRGADTEWLGASVTRTATLHTRRGPAPRFAPTPAGLVLSDIPTIGFRTLLKEEGRRWDRSSVPVVVSLAGSAAELGDMAATLESIEAVAGLLLQAEADPVAAAAAVRAQTPRPILVVLDYAPDLVRVAAAVVAAGADTLVVAAPPRGIGGDPPVAGYLLGPAVFPLTLRLLADVAGTGVPCIALGGIATPALAQAALLAGAAAVMIDAPRWGDLRLPSRIVLALGLPAPGR